MSHRIHISHPSGRAVAVAAMVLALIVGTVLGFALRGGSAPGQDGFEPPRIVTRVQAVAYVPERHAQFVLPERHSQFGVADNLSPLKPQSFSANGVADNLSPLNPQSFNTNGVAAVAPTQPMTGGLPDYAVEGWEALPAANPLGYQPISGGVPTYAVDTYEPISGGLPPYATSDYEPMSGGVPDYAE
ncbi:hypothetical protein [Demequina silvatica]|uniref:hypothetical protein n=1 Tax=Demequina silvatica TaxID=1638988 RepID=UPI000785F06F|nr:hypothetical protein [Demequina silvatica]